MSRGFATQQLRLNAVDVRNETTDPNAALAAGAIGSYWVRNGAYTANPVEQFLRLNNNAAGFGWVKQNTVNVNVFNVKNFGAVGDGVTIDTAAITAAIAAANAAGGGEVYFPPAPLGYAVTRVLAQQSIFEMGNMANITLRGDGFSSRIKVTGDFGGASQFLFRLFDRTHGIRFTGLRFDASTMTNPHAGGQNHFIQVSSAPPDVGPPHDVDIVGNYFGVIRGAGIRVLGEVASGREPYDIRISMNACDGAGDGVENRSFVEAQRDSLRVQVHHNWTTGIKNSPIDFEPTGATVENSPTGWSIVGNILDTVATEAITLSGWSPSHPSDTNICNYNITGGANIQGLELQNLELRGNIVTQNNANTESCVHFFSALERVLIIGNILVSLTSAENRSAISLFGDAGGNPLDCSIIDNVCSSQVASVVNPGLFLTTCNRSLTMGNLVYHNTTPAANFGILLRATLAVGNQWCVIGNLVICSGTVVTFGIDITTGGNFDIRNVLVNHNYCKGTANGIGWDTSGGKVFLDWRMCDNNSTPGATTSTVSPPTTNVGVSVDGTAGPGPQIAHLNVSTGPETRVTARIGSVCMNVSGVAGAILNYKESGTGNTGWVGFGAAEMTMGTLAGSTATAARFLAPGSELTVEGTTEIKFAVSRPGTIRNLRLKCVAGVGGGNNTYTLRKNATNTIAAITVANTATIGNSTSAFTVVAGDLISLQVTKSAAPGTPQTNIMLAFELH